MNQSSETYMLLSFVRSGDYDSPDFFLISIVTEAVSTASLITETGQLEINSS